MRINVVTDIEEGVIDLSDFSAYPDLEMPDEIDVNDTDEVEDYLAEREVQILELANELETLTDDDEVNVYFGDLDTEYHRVLAKRIEAGVNGEEYQRSDESYTESSSDSEDDMSSTETSDEDDLLQQEEARSETTSQPPLSQRAAPIQPAPPARARVSNVQLAHSIKTNFVPPEDLPEFIKREPTKIRPGLKMETFDVWGKTVTVFELKPTQ